MEVIILPDAQQVAQMAAQRFINQININPQSVLGLATGSTPLGVYQILVEAQKRGEVDFSKVTTFNLDEYVGVSKDHPGSYHSYMKKNFFEPAGLKEGQYFLPDGTAKNIPEHCQQYEKKIAELGPIDLQLLGIGRDGHIGFNEPGSSLGSRTRLKTLSETTRADNKAIFSKTEELPFHVITMGIQSIMDAEEIVLLATGDSKAQAVADCVEGPITARVPASVLQFHPKTKIILDEAAASRLSLKSYYQEVFAKKPPWQKSEII